MGGRERRKDEREEERKGKCREKGNREGRDKEDYRRKTGRKEARKERWKKKKKGTKEERKGRRKKRNGGEKNVKGIRRREGRECGKLGGRKEGREWSTWKVLSACVGESGRDKIGMDRVDRARKK